MISDRRIYLTRDLSEAVEENDDRAAFLLVGKGSTIDAKTVEKYGIVIPRPIPAAPLNVVVEEEDGKSTEAKSQKGKKNG